MDPRPVEVLHDGRWVLGTLDRWKQDERGWLGHCWFSTEPGSRYVQWVPAERLRPVDTPEVQR